ncbi:hypothetical protein LXL04_036749 [Taraxacum kok-saghyz]
MVEEIEGRTASLVWRRKAATTIAGVEKEKENADRWWKKEVCGKPVPHSQIRHLPHRLPPRRRNCSPYQLNFTHRHFKFPPIMGGDTISHPDSSIDDEHLSINQQFLDRLSKIATPRRGGLSAKTTEENESVYTESNARSFRDSYNTSEIKANELRTHSVYAQALKNYDDLKQRALNIDAAKSKILSYTPGSWIENVGGTTMNDYNLPKTTTLLLIGLKGSGKSSLINRISKVFEDDKFAPERAQVTYNSSIGNGTSFLHEYMIPRTSTSFCLYDTPSFSNNSSENSQMIKHWMTKGVSHNEFVKRLDLITSIIISLYLYEYQIPYSSSSHKTSYKKRKVNFVIFVVNGLSVLKSMSTNGEHTQYTDTLSEAFSSPYLCFKDHKPAIAITHGDLLTLSERARVCIHLGEILNVHPIKQTFDIPDNFDPTTELTIVDLLRYALEHADRNLPVKSRHLITKGHVIQKWACLLLLLSLGMMFVTHGSHSVKYHEPGLEMKEVVRESVEVVGESVGKESVGGKGVDVERAGKEKVGKGRKCEGRGREEKEDDEESMEIDWKKIRHLWYDG